MNAAVYLLQFYNSVGATLNCTLCSIFLIILENMHVQRKPQFNVDLYGTIALHNVEVRSAGKTLYVLYFMQ